MFNRKKKKEEKPALISVLDSIYAELESLERQIAELLITLTQNGCLTTDQAKELLNANKKEEDK